MITKVVLKAMPPESSTLLLQSWKEETGNDLIVVRFVAFVLLIRPFEGEVVVAVSATILVWHSNDLRRCQRQSWRSRSHGSKHYHWGDTNLKAPRMIFFFTVIQQQHPSHKLTKCHLMRQSLSQSHFSQKLSSKMKKLFICSRPTKSSLLCKRSPNTWLINGSHSFSFCAGFFFLFFQVIFEGLKFLWVLISCFKTSNRTHPV